MGRSSSSLRLKDSERRLVTELMRNSRRSDRQLSKALHVSLATVSRMIKKLEKEGVIQEYTMIPDFRKLGYTLVAATFAKLRQTKDTKRIAEAKEIAAGYDGGFGVVMIELGVGLGHDGMLLSYHENYASYLKFLDKFRRDFPETEKLDAFIMNLDDKIRYLPLTLKQISQHQLRQTQQQKQ
jgi:DNA-binding Lrp family transcriptional regulator